MTYSLRNTHQVDPRPTGRIFMTAEWTNLVLVNYRVPTSLLESHLPPDCKLDTPPDDSDLHILSVVSMDFSRTRVFGRPVPGGEHFNEINLRFYVREGDRHGVVFLREFVPNWALVAGARLFYNQPYFRAGVRHEIRRENNLIVGESRLDHGGLRGGVSFTALDEPAIPRSTSIDHFLKERYWGFYRDHFGRTLRFRVQRPVWRTFPITGYDVSYDPGLILGGSWRDIDWPAALHSVVFAEGSSATVYWPERTLEDGR